MSELLHFDSLEAARLPAGPLHLAIGMFDGLHLGHQSVIAAAVHSAQRSGGLAGALTFWPHPSVLFRPETPTPLLMPAETKRQMLTKLGLSFVIEQNFSRAFAAIEAREFLAFLRQQLPQLAAVYVGENWRFGRARAGDVALLVETARPLGMEVFSAPRLNHNGEPISSSRIRELMAAGEVAAANALLGYAYFSAGTVERGRQLGRMIGFPTLNLSWQPELKPRFGVYAVEVEKDGRLLPGVANYGLRPTVEQTTQPLLEVHLLHDTTLTYGDAVVVNWRQFLRAERKFNGVEELRAQIALDREAALKFFHGQTKH